MGNTPTLRRAEALAGVTAIPEKAVPLRSKWFEEQPGHSSVTTIFTAVSEHSPFSSHFI